MLFSKGGKTIKDKFEVVVNDTEIEYVSQYKYLGVNISNTGKFSLAEKTIDEMFELSFKGYNEFDKIL